MGLAKSGYEPTLGAVGFWNGWNRIVYALWSRVYDRLVGVPVIEKGRRTAMEFLKLQGGERIVLVGVGTGADFEYLPEGCRAVGIDQSEAMLTMARRKLPMEGREIELQPGNAEQLPFEDAEFDAAVLNLILSVVDDGAACLREAVRVVRPGGRLVVFDKFVPAGEKPSLLRRMLNLLTRPFGTDITRQFEPMCAGLPCQVEEDVAAGFSGAYRAILLVRQAAS